MRILEIKDLASAEKELLNIGADPSGIKYMAPKAFFQAIKIPNVPTVAANIIKQEMLSFGGEAAVSKGSLVLREKTTDLLIFGTLKQIRQLCDKLKDHQFGLPALAKKIKLGLDNYRQTPPPIKIGSRKLNFGKRTYIMGIINATHDSFYDGGKHQSLDDQIKLAERMIKDGADIIDIGGESTRPGSKPIRADEELKRVLPIISALKKKKIIISIDTQKASVAEKAILSGAHIINDISGLRSDKNMAKLAAKYQVPIILMHMKGTPKNMQEAPTYQNLIDEIIEYFEKALETANNAGILPNQIILDPGFGFGKTPEHNLEILAIARNRAECDGAIEISKAFGTCKKLKELHIY
jgi:dihydropteroate synthase